MGDNLFHNMKFQFCELTHGSDNETIVGAEVDTLGYEGVAFIVMVEEGEVATHTAKIQQDTVTGMGTAADLEGSAVEIVGSVTVPQMAVYDVKGPRERFVRLSLAVADVTATPAIGIIAVLYGATRVPVAQTGAYYVNPVEGTA